jgi:hypothetical protein
MSGASMVRSKLTGNFLIRSRRHLANDQIATLIVDCPTDSGDSCSPAYQSSLKRLADVDRLVAEARREIPSIQKVWLIGTSLGTVSSAFLAKYGGEKFSGAIHTASITAPYANGSVRELAEFDYGAVTLAQAFVHHKDDPCKVTPYAEAVKISNKFNLPLLTVYGGSDFSGDACHASTQHGFKGMERTVMLEIAAIVINGKAISKDVGRGQEAGR